MRTADHVFHRPSGETWVVAWADNETGYMAPCGWPECQAKISDCYLVRSATDDECRALCDELAASGRRDSLKASTLRAARDGDGRDG